MNDYESIQRKRNIAVGLFVFLGLCSLFWLVFKFGDLPIAVSKWKSFEVTIRFPKAAGVQKKTAVQFCGYQIGSVTKVEPPKVLRNLKTDKSYHQTAVIVSIDKRYNDIPEDLRAKLIARGLGSSYIELVALAGDANEPVTEFLKDGSVLQGCVGISSELFPEETQKKLNDLAVDLAKLVKNANDIIGDDENKGNIKTALANLSEASNQATETLKEIQKFSAHGIDTSQELSKAVVQLSVILEKIDNGQGTIARFLNDGKLYESLLENSEQVEVLLQNMKIFIEQSNKDGLPIKLK
ncbi:MAG: MCE family protein [Planctomycetes bacterium]|nr:MCE family protein [Planctomycetota bacterium]